MRASFDIVIRNGTVIDGSGSEPFSADIAIKKGKIVAVGSVDGSGITEIDATDRIVTPGFVDIHTHYDGQITWEQTLRPSSYHGVTTVLMGNCGVGFAPCKPEHRQVLVKVMEGVEDIPEVVMAAGIPWSWQSFPEYLDFLDQRHADIDFATQVPHAPVRVQVMGQRGADREPPTEQELAQMTALVAEGIRAGAMGVSTSRSLGHRRTDGELAPTVVSEEAELLALAKGLQEAGAGVFQLITGLQEGSRDPQEEMVTLRKIVEVSGGRPLSFTLLQTFIRPQTMNETLAFLDRAAAEDLPIKGQVFPRPVGLLLGLDCSFHPFRLHPGYKAIETLSLSERVAEMRKPAMRARLLGERPEHSNMIWLYIVSSVAELYELRDPPVYEPLPEDKLGNRAQRMGVSVEELAYDLLLENNGTNTFLFPGANYVGDSLDAVHQMLQHPQTLIGLGDGGAHYGMICDSSYPTTLLAYWTRDRVGPRLPLPWAIRALSYNNALAMGLSDRGLIQCGMRADINVINYDRLQLHAPHMTTDLPMSGSRLTQKATGYDATIVDGTITYRNGIHTGAFPGRLIRNPATAWTRPSRSNLNATR
jgi:N-acyl-D-amino-acid deacylase